MFLKNKNIISKIRRSKVTEYAALKGTKPTIICKIIFALTHKPLPLGWGLKVKTAFRNNVFIFQEHSCHVAYQMGIHVLHNNTT